MDWLSSLGNIFPGFVSEHLADWLLTGVITFFTTRFATREFYEKNRKAIAESILLNSLRELLRLPPSEPLPKNAKVIFVEYRGRCFKLKKAHREELKCRFGEKTRRTVVKKGRDVSDISSCRPVNFGVLGVANLEKRPVIYNFASRKLYLYNHGRFRELKTEKIGNSTYYTAKGKKIELSSGTSDRDTMIAVPIVEYETLYGGITYDMYNTSLDNPVYQEILDSDTDEIRKTKLKNNEDSLTIATDTATSLITVYFKKKSEAHS